MVFTNLFWMTSYEVVKKCLQEEMNTGFCRK